MSDKIVVNVIPNIKAVDLGDGTYGVATVTETAQDRGIATGGSNVTCIDTTKAWIVNHFIGDTLEVTIDEVEYHSLITANTANTITMNVIGAVVVAGAPYKIISAAGAESTIADGADVTQGAIADAIVAAGAAGTNSAKLRRLTSDLAGVLLDTADIETATEAINTALQAGGITQLQLAALLTGVILATGTNAIGRVGHDVTGIADNRRVVVAAGTRLTLVAATIPAKAVTITAEDNNTGVIVIGGATCVAALATRRGTPLDSGDSVTIACDDLVDIYLDSTVAGDGVTFTYIT